MITDPATFRYHPGPIDKQYNIGCTNLIGLCEYGVYSRLV